MKRIEFISSIRFDTKDMKVSKHKAIDCLSNWRISVLLKRGYEERQTTFICKNFVSASCEVQKLHSEKGPTWSKNTI